MTINSSQVLQNPFLYTNNFNLAYLTTTSIAITSGQKRDNQNETDMFNTLPLIVSGASNGANALDTGTLAASTWYYVHVIFNSLSPNTPAAGLLSLSPTAPTLPTGYNTFALQGYLLTDGSAHFLKFYVSGVGTDRQHFWDSDISVLSAGTATTLTAINLSTAVPPVDMLAVRLDVNYTPATAGDKVSIAPGGSTATILPHVTGQVATVAASGQLLVRETLVIGVPTIQYINSAASGSTTVWVNGFNYSV